MAAARERDPASAADQGLAGEQRADGQLLDDVPDAHARAQCERGDGSAMFDWQPPEVFAAAPKTSPSEAADRDVHLVDA